MATEAALIGRDDIERFKVYIEIAKYAIAIVIALAAVVGVIIKQKAEVSGLSVGMMSVGIVVNIGFFLVCHRLVSDAASAILKPMPANGVQDTLAAINDGVYSLFVIAFVGSLAYWSLTILGAVLT